METTAGGQKTVQVPEGRGVGGFFLGAGEWVDDSCSWVLEGFWSFQQC